MFFVYILSLNDNQFYKGLTNNLERRLKQHKEGKVKSTMNKGRYQLIHVELCKNRELARKYEKLFKSGFGRELIKEILEYA